MKSFLKKSKLQSDEMSLQITSMADIFTILLVFLLKGYSTGAVSITPTQGLILPEAVAAAAPPVEALKLEVTENAIQVEGKPISTLVKYRFSESDLRNDKSSKSLATALEQERKRQLLIAKSNSDVKIDSKIIVLADRRVPYETIKSVLASAAIHGYTDFKLAVVKGE